MNDIQINPKQDENSENSQDLDATDYIVDGATSGGDVLREIKKIRVDEKEKVVYGIYDNTKSSFMVRLNDFLIDRSKVRLKEKSYFFHMLAVMVDSGITVTTAIRSLADRGRNPRLKRVLATVGYNCESGAKLADSMSRYEDVFDESEIGVIRAGEETGTLHSILFKLSRQLDKRYDLNMKLITAAVYPIAVLAVLIIVATGMLVWVLPSLLSMLAEGGVTTDKLPGSTRALMFIQVALVDFWWLIAIVGLILFGFFRLYVNSDYGAVRWDHRKLTLPIIGEVMRKVYVLRFIGMLGLLIEAGIPVIKALKITGGALPNRIYKLKVQEIINSVRKGQKISDSLADSEFLFPPEVTQMMRVGESTASIAKISEKIADQYQREVDNSIKKLSAVFEPVMILFVGLFVALLALAIMAPIFNLSSTVGY